MGLRKRSHLSDLRACFGSFALKHVHDTHDKHLHDKRALFRADEGKGLGGALILRGGGLGGSKQG